MLKRIALAGLAACALCCISLPADAMQAAKSIAIDPIVIHVADNPCKGLKGDERKNCLKEQRAEKRKEKYHQESSGGGRGGPGNGSD